MKGQDRHLQRIKRELLRTRRALKMLRYCNNVLFQTTDETSLLKEICRVAVEQGGYRMAWVGYAQHDDKKTIQPVAQAGFEQGYLESINVRWADAERGRGPMGIAVRTGKAMIARNIPTDPAFRPWRVQAVKRGYASCIALPLPGETMPMGAMVVYAPEPDAFDESEVGLLVELARELAYGIRSLRAKEESRLAAMEIQRERDKAQKYLDIAQVILLALDREGRVALLNRKGLRVLGYRENHLLGQNWFETCLPPSIRDAVRSEFQKIMSTGVVALEYHESPVVTRSGAERIIAWHCAAMRGADGRVFGTLSSGEDITDRRELERQLGVVAQLERERMSRDLHDSVCQQLSAIALLSSDLVRDIRKRCPPRDVRNAAQIGALAAETVTMAREIARNIAPQFADFPAFLEAADDLAERIALVHNLTCSFKKKGQFVIGDRNLLSQLFLIAQEAATNAARHSRGKVVEILLGGSRGRARLAVRDNGRGIVSEKNNDGMGLNIMKFRAQAIGWSLTIRRGKNGGTVVECEGKIA